MPDTSSLTAETAFAVIYIISLVVGIIVYGRWKKKYRRIPEKTVTATLIRQSDYFGDGGRDYPLDPRVSYSVGKYEYSLDGRRHVIKLRFTGSIPDTATLYYRKGSSDVRTRSGNLPPDRVRVFAILYFLIGAALVAFLVTKAFGFDL